MLSPEVIQKSASNPADGVHSNWRGRQRAAVACQSCGRRKVRCNVSTSGRPCTNCQHDRVECEVLPRKKHAPRRKKPCPSLEERREVANQLDKVGSKTLDEQSNIQGPLSTNNELLRETEASRYYPEAQSIPNTSSATGHSTSDQGLLDPGLEETADSGNFAVALDAPTVPIPEGNPMLGYIGDQQGTGTFMHTICNDPADIGTHYLVPRIITTRIQYPEDLAYLRIKGCFSLPSPSVGDLLVKCYFHHVHPFLPIINARSFLEEFSASGYRNLSLLLLWSIFFAASSFVELEVLQRAGYVSRKAMKRAMYQRAKCLYDIDYEEDKISLIQSVILMAFWYSDTEDRTGAWHWIGIAISLGHTIGLHRNPEVANPQRRLPRAQINILKRIWWSCVVRDKWLSLALGRPVRINPSVCEMPMPIAEDVVHELESISPQTRERYLPSNPEWLAELWVTFLKISDLLGTIIRVFYQPQVMKPDENDLLQYEDELLRCATAIDPAKTKDRISLLHSYQLQLFYEAAIIVLHRPYVRIPGKENVYETEHSWQADSHQKAKAAAANFNRVLEQIVEADMVSLLKPMTITTLILAMQMHLLEIKSPAPLSRRLGNHKLQLCMMVLSELRFTYWGADATYKLFERARTRLWGMKVNDSSILSSTDDPKLVPLTPDSTTYTMDGQSDRPNSLDILLSSESFLWDQSNPFMIMPNMDVGQNLSFSNTEGLQDRECLNADYDLSSILSFEQFQTQPMA